MAHFVRWTRMPLAWAELFGSGGAVSDSLGSEEDREPAVRRRAARWAGWLVAAMFTLPVAGTALYMADQHLHPRTWPRQ
jgi:hypothetical protein